MNSGVLFSHKAKGSLQGKRGRKNEAGGLMRTGLCSGESECNASGLDKDYLGVVLRAFNPRVPEAEAEREAG